MQHQLLFTKAHYEEMAWKGPPPDFGNLSQQRWEQLSYCAEDLLIWALVNVACTCVFYLAVYNAGNFHKMERTAERRFSDEMSASSWRTEASARYLRTTLLLKFSVRMSCIKVRNCDYSYVTVELGKCGTLPKLSRRLNQPHEQLLSTPMQGLRCITGALCTLPSLHFVYWPMVRCTCSCRIYYK